MSDNDVVPKSVLTSNQHRKDFRIKVGSMSFVDVILTSGTYVVRRPSIYVENILDLKVRSTSAAEVVSSRELTST